MCIESILAQTYSDIELILVDDGSPDSCPAICDYYAEKDSRVKVIHKPNGGVSCARNTGHKNAEGCFVMFVDSDDYIAPTMLQEMLSRMDDDIDGVFSGLKYVFPDRSKNKVNSLPDAIVHMPEELDQYYQSLLSAFGNFTSCAKLYRRSTLLTNDVYFEEKIALLEDATFVRCFLRHCRKCRFMSEAFYTYRQLDEESLVKRFHPNANEALVVYYLNSLWMQDHLSQKTGGTSRILLIITRFSLLLKYMIALDLVPKKSYLP